MSELEAYGLRPYQEEAVHHILTDFEDYRSTLLVLPTGCGKTQVFVVAMDQCEGRTLVLAHRRELLYQAGKRFEQLTNQTTGIEMAEHSTMGGVLPDVVLASVQTMQRRMGQFSPQDFSQIVIDEAHHAVSATYTDPLRYFSQAKVLGVTATPDRLDDEKLGQVFDHVAYVYDLRQAVEEGWLVDIIQQRIQVEGLDLSKCRTLAGDFNEGDLEKILIDEEQLHHVAVPTLEMAEARQTLLFCVTVNHAKMLAEILNRYKPGCATSLDGQSSNEERVQVLEDFSQGRIQFLTNCALFTEGVDIPIVSCVAMARPTKSRALYSQAVGRGTRLSPGKENLLVLDYVGNSGRHKLITAVDIFGEELDEDVEEEAERLAEEQVQASVLSVLAQAQENVSRRKREQELERQREWLTAQQRMHERQHIQVGVRYSQSIIDPFSWAGMSGQKQWGIFHQSPDEETAELLQRHGLKPYEFDAAQAKEMRRAIHVRIKRGLCTYKQTKKLWEFGIDASQWTYQQAHDALDQIAGARWRPSRELIQELRSLQNANDFSGSKTRKT